MLMGNVILKEAARQLGEEARCGLEELLRQGARRMLQQAIENEVAEYLEWYAHLRDDAGRRVVVRHGSLPERNLVTGIGRIGVRQPRVRDRQGRERFNSRILLPYMRRVPSIDALIPALYLREISTAQTQHLTISHFIGRGN